MSTTTTTLRSPTRYFWLQLAALGAGLGVLLLAHHLTRRLDQSTAGTTFVTVAVILVVTLSLALVWRAVHVIVTSAFSDAYRVFRSRHLLSCGMLLSFVAAVEAGALIRRGPFVKFFAHGRITGEVIVDVATVVAALVCLVGAGVALTGAWDRMHAERNWHRMLQPHRRRQS
jgi:hypothetical protein